VCQSFGILKIKNLNLGISLKIFVILLLFFNLYADDIYSLRIAKGKVSDSDLGEILGGYWKPHKYDLQVLALDGGYLLTKNAYELPLDIYARAGLAYFDEDATQNDIYEFTLYIKAYYSFDFLNNRCRFGFGEGLSYTSDVLISEYLEATEKHDNYSQLLNYLDISFDFDFGRLIAYEPLYNTYIAWTIKHRSGVFGLFNNVSHGGSNYNTLSIEKNF